MAAGLEGRVDGSDGTGTALLALGGFGALALALVLIPLREMASASHLAFVFLAWTIVVAELGGRAAALVTALVSALSLNFFLTRPYLTLRMDDPDDIVAFFALAACGLIAALFGRRRQHSEAAVGRAHEALATIRDVVSALERNGGREARLATALDGLRRFAGLQGLALRESDGRIAVVSPPGFAAPAGAPTPLEADSVVAAGPTARLALGRRGLRLPEAGGRLSLRHGGRAVGSLDVWEAEASGLDPDQVVALRVKLAGTEPRAESRHG
jgi:two-component system sensor histidine kinase KdpD